MTDEPKSPPQPTFMEQLPDGAWRPTDRNTGVVYWPDAPSVFNAFGEPRGTSMLRPMYANWIKRNPPATQPEHDQP